MLFRGRSFAYYQVLTTALIADSWPTTNPERKAKQPRHVAEQNNYIMEVEVSHHADVEIALHTRNRT